MLEGNHSGVPQTLLRRLAKRIGESLPARVWGRVVAHNGMMLSAGISYQAMFSVFSALYVVLAFGGLWLVSNVTRLDTLIDTLNQLVPGIIGPTGIVDREPLLALSTADLTPLGVSGTVAVAVLIWTASEWVAFARIATRSMFGLGKDPTPFLVLKARDVIAAVVFALLLIVGAAASAVSTRIFDALITSLHLDAWSGLSVVATRMLSIALVLTIDTTLLLALFVTLSGANLRVQHAIGGALLGAIALTALQLLGSNLLAIGNTNPLLATFVVFVTLLLWFRLTAMITLLAAGWIAERAVGRGAPIASRPFRATGLGRFAR